MDENMNKDFELNNEEKAEDIPKQEPQQSYTAPKQEPVTPPTGYSTNYNPQYTYNSYNNQQSQFMPYGSYGYNPNVQQQQKKKSKGKKKGCLVTVLILLAVFGIAIGVLISAFTGAVLSIINFIRTCLFINKDKFSTKLYVLILEIMYIFIGLLLI